MRSVRKAVVTAAGHGTRQYPATQTVQKELLPLVDTDGYTKPTLQIILEDAWRSGIEEFCIIANSENAEPIRHHFRGLTEADRNGRFRDKAWALPHSDILNRIGERLTVVVQERQEGYGHAVYQAKEWVGSDPFVMLLGDHVNISLPGQSTIDEIVQIHERRNAPVSSVQRIKESDIKRYGTAAGEPIADSAPPQYMIRTMAEKPSIEFAQASLRTPGLADDEYLCMYGVHALTPDIFDCLDHLVKNDIRERGEIQFAAAQLMLSQERQYVIAELSGHQYDMGIPEGLLQTQLALAMRSPYRDQVIKFIHTESE